MHTGRLPFCKDVNEPTMKQTFDRILSGDLHIPLEFQGEKDFNSILAGLMNIDPRNRLQIEEIKSHPYFKTIDCSTHH